jgi:predicted PurR-regulated permease PerM
MTTPAAAPPAPFRPVHAAAIVLAAGAAVVALWFLQKIVTAILLFFLALVVAVALSAPLGWLRRRGLPRKAAAGITLLGFFGTVGLIGWMVFPELARQLAILIASLPDLIGKIDAQIAQLLARHPELQALASSEAQGLQGLAPDVGNIFRNVGNFSLSLIGAVALTIIFMSAVIYTVLDPRPILKGYLGTLPQARRGQGVRAYRRAARAVIGWTEASLIVGAIEFVLVFGVLTYIGLPGVLIWAALAFFAEFIPRIGGYIMAFPPVVVALTLGPATALWVAIFYLAMNELLGNLVAPRIRGETMKIHPVLLLFFTLAFALAFGMLGAIVATPAAAFFSAYYSEFYIARHRPGA